MSIFAKVQIRPQRWRDFAFRAMGIQEVWEGWLQRVGTSFSYEIFAGAMFRLGLSFTLSCPNQLWDFLSLFFSFFSFLSSFYNSSSSHSLWAQSICGLKLGVSRVWEISQCPFDPLIHHLYQLAYSAKKTSIYRARMTPSTHKANMVQFLG